jgi:hypothetical protein
MENECGRLRELLELNRTAKGRSLPFGEVSRSSGRIAEGGGIYLMWDPVENRWVRVGETEAFCWRWQEHWNWATNLFGHVGHAICHSSGSEHLIPFLYRKWNQAPPTSRENLEQLQAHIKQYLADWTLTWVPVPEGHIALRLFLEGNLIAALSEVQDGTDRWMGRSLATCSCGGMLKTRAARITRSQLWNVERLVDGRQTPGWLEYLEKHIG